MVEFDETDAEILELLIADAKRPYKEIGEEVGLSAPSVSSRVERLRDLGVIRRFTLDIDRSLLTTGDATLIELKATPGAAADIAAHFHDERSIEHVIRTTDGRILVLAHLTQRELDPLLSDLDGDDLLTYEVRDVAESAWSPRLGSGDLSIECVQCGKPIDTEGIAIERDDRRYYVCCESCEQLFTEKYETLERRAAE